LRTDHYTQIFQDAAAVEKYEHVVYAPDSYSSAVNRRQRAFLRGLVKREFPYRRPVQHDFACGTGRAIRLLHGLVRAAHGYDTSAAMLAKAGEVGAFAELHRIEAEGPVPTPVRSDGPTIVTIFRLLLNIGDEVRERAIAFAAQALPHQDSGLLVVENHGNRESLRHLRHRHKAGQAWFAELSHADVEALLSRHGFTLVQCRGFALFPQGWYDRPWLRPFVRVVDDVCGRLGWLHRYAVTVVYVARRRYPATARPAETTAVSPANLTPAAETAAVSPAVPAQSHAQPR
jgi:predicted TPR repeat methyltransferase